MTDKTPTRGQLLGQYELVAAIARGGMGQIWAARLRGGRGFQKLVALKTILPLAQELPRIERMLQEEARLAALVQHPNVVQTIDLGEHDGILYLVMEWVDGEPLHKVMKLAHESEAIPLPIAVSWVAQACRGLHAAHEARNEEGELVGLVHRDVSPQNILITHAGTAKLFDFGIAKAMNQASSLTEVGEIKGKFSYMAPEQLLAKPVDRRADLFSMGIVLYWLTVGRHPFRDENPGQAVLGITKAEPAPRPSRYVPGYPRALEEVVMRALEKAPERRFQTAEQMSVALQRAVPEAFALGIDLATEKYLYRLLGDRAQSRRSLLRRAQEKLDSMRPPAAATPSEGVGSIGSLKAIVVDQQSAGAVAGATGEREPVTRPDSRRGLASRSKSVLRSLALVAAVMPIALGAGVWIRSAWQPTPAGSAVAATAQAITPLAEAAPAPAPAPAPSAVQSELPAVTPEAVPSGAAPAVSARRASPARARAVRKVVEQPPSVAPRRDGRDVGLLPPDYADKK